MVPDAAMDVVGTNFLISVMNGMPFHRQQRRYRANCHLNGVHSSGWYRSSDCHHLVKAQRELGTVRLLHGEVAYQRRYIPHYLCVSVHQEANNDLNRAAAVNRSNLADKLKSKQNFALLVAAFN